MSETQRYHFFRKRPGKPLVWCSTRTDKSGTMFEWIEDLRKKFDVTTEDEKNYIIADREP